MIMTKEYIYMKADDGDRAEKTRKGGSPRKDRADGGSIDGDHII